MKTYKALEQFEYFVPNAPPRGVFGSPICRGLASARRKVWYNKMWQFDPIHFLSESIIIYITVELKNEIFFLKREIRQDFKG